MTSRFSCRKTGIRSVYFCFHEKRTLIQNSPFPHPVIFSVVNQCHIRLCLYKELKTIYGVCRNGCQSKFPNGNSVHPWTLLKTQVIEVNLCFDAYMLTNELKLLLLLYSIFKDLKYSVQQLLSFVGQWLIPFYINWLLYLAWYTLKQCSVP